MTIDAKQRASESRPPPKRTRARDAMDSTNRRERERREKRNGMRPSTQDRRRVVNALQAGNPDGLASAWFAERMHGCAVVFSARPGVYGVAGAPGPPVRQPWQVRMVTERDCECVTRTCAEDAEGAEWDIDRSTANAVAAAQRLGEIAPTFEPSCDADDCFTTTTHPSWWVAMHLDVPGSPPDASAWVWWERALHRKHAGSPSPHDYHDPAPARDVPSPLERAFLRAPVRDALSDALNARVIHVGTPSPVHRLLTMLRTHRAVHTALTGEDHAQPHRATLANGRTVTITHSAAAGSVRCWACAMTDPEVSEYVSELSRSGRLR